MVVPEPSSNGQYAARSASWTTSVSITRSLNTVLAETARAASTLCFNSTVPPLPAKTALQAKPPRSVVVPLDAVKTPPVTLNGPTPSDARSEG